MRKLTPFLMLLLMLPAGKWGPAGAEKPAAEPPAPPEARRAHLIALALEGGRVAEALVDAQTAVKRFPESALLRLRLAQAQLCQAIQLDGQLEETLEDTAFARTLDRGVEFLRRVLRDDDPTLQDIGPLIPTPEQMARMRAAHQAGARDLLAPELMAEIARFQDSARERLKESEPLIERRSRSLLETFAALKEARRLGDESTELELTDLWAQAVPVLWRDELARLGKLGPPAAAKRAPGAPAPANPLEPQLDALKRALAPFEHIKEDAVLRAAVELGRRRPTDPEALAGAADVIALIAGITGRPDSLRAHIMGLLDRRYLKNPSLFVPALGPVTREALRRTYADQRDLKELPDVVAAPSAVSLQLYRRALRQDLDYKLPYLRLRLYLLAVAFDPDEARKLLDEVKDREPRNAVVPLEQARMAFLLENKPQEGIARCREAARLTEFSRSYLVAVPAPLRNVLKFHRGVREWVKKAWPGYPAMLGTLQDAEWLQLGAPISRGPLKAKTAAEAALQWDLRWLRLKLAGLLCQAPDYPDQAEGISLKTNVLGDLLALKEPLPPVQRALLRLQQEEHARTFADYPRARSSMTWSTKGLGYLQYPQTGADSAWPRQPYLVVSPTGDVMGCPAR